MPACTYEREKEKIAKSVVAKEKRGDGLLTKKNGGCNLLAKRVCRRVFECKKVRVSNGHVAV